MDFFNASLRPKNGSQYQLRLSKDAAVMLCCAAPLAIASKFVAAFCGAKRAHDGQGDSGSCVLG
jgi:hypothetical protein